MAARRNSEPGAAAARRDYYDLRAVVAARGHIYRGALVRLLRWVAGQFLLRSSRLDVLSRLCVFLALVRRGYHRA